MRALVVRQFGDPKLLKIEEITTPAPGDGQVLVKIMAAGINPSDVKNVQGVMHGTTLPRIPGRDFAGVVVCGPGDAVGREVWGTGGDIGFTKDGSHAQYILLPLAAIATKPAMLSMDAAGSAGLVFVTARSALIGAAAISAAETALILGASGGVGSAAVQLAKWRGAKVIGAVRSDAEAAYALENGADDVVNTKSDQWIDAVRSLAGGAGASVVFDTTGQMFAESIEAAGQSGRICVISAPADGKATFNLRNLYRKELRVYGIDTRPMDAVACAKLLTDMTAGFESGALKATPGESRPLSAAGEAYDLVAHGKGRFYLRPND